MKRCIVFGIAAALALGACKKEEKPQEQAPTASEAPRVELTDAMIDRSRVPVKEDFEEHAAQTIDDINLESQIDELEEEIDGDAN